jgi:hypothetical protein
MDEKFVERDLEGDHEDKTISPLPLTSSSSGTQNQVGDTHVAITTKGRDEGEPDIDHYEIEAAVPGHSLDVNLAAVSSHRLFI